MSYKCSKNSTVNNAVCCASSISRKLFHSIDYICGNFFGNKLIIDIIFTFLRWPWFFLMEGLLNQGHLEFLGHNFIGRARKVNAVICFSSFLNVHRSASFFETRRPKICTTFFSHFFLFFFSYSMRNPHNQIIHLKFIQNKSYFPRKKQMNSPPQIDLNCSLLL